MGDEEEREALEEEVWAEEAWPVGTHATPWAEKRRTLFWRGTNSFARRRRSGAPECAGRSFWFNCSARATLVAASLALPEQIDAGFTSFAPREECLCGTPFAEVQAIGAAQFEPMEAQSML